MKKIFSLLLTLTMVLSLAACGGNSAAPSTPGSDSSNTGSDTASDSDTIKIGYVSDLTGATALWGTAGQYGAELAIKQVNENGGVLDGKMLELVPMDGKGEPPCPLSRIWWRYITSWPRSARTSPPATSPWPPLPTR